MNFCIFDFLVVWMVRCGFLLICLIVLVNIFEIILIEWMLMVRMFGSVLSENISMKVIVRMMLGSVWVRMLMNCVVVC